MLLFLITVCCVALTTPQGTEIAGRFRSPYWLYAINSNATKDFSLTTYDTLQSWYSSVSLALLFKDSPDVSSLSWNLQRFYCSLEDCDYSIPFHNITPGSHKTWGVEFNPSFVNISCNPRPQEVEVLKYYFNSSRSCSDRYQNKTLMAVGFGKEYIRKVLLPNTYLSNHGWFVPLKRNKQYPFDGRRDVLYIMTHDDADTEKHVAISFDTGKRILWRFSDWGVLVPGCTSHSFKMKLTSVPDSSQKIWELKIEKEQLTLRCNGVLVLTLVYVNAYMNGYSDCPTFAKQTFTGFIFTHEDTASEYFKINSTGIFQVAMKVYSVNTNKYYSSEPQLANSQSLTFSDLPITAANNQRMFDPVEAPLYQVNLGVNDLVIYSQYDTYGMTTHVHFLDNYNNNVTSLSWNNTSHGWCFTLDACKVREVNDTAVPLLNTITWVIRFTSSRVVITGNEMDFLKVDLPPPCSPYLMGEPPQRMMFDENDTTSMAFALNEAACRSKHTPSILPSNVASFRYKPVKLGEFTNVTVRCYDGFGLDSNAPLFYNYFCNGEYGERGNYFNGNLQIANKYPSPRCIAKCGANSFDKSKIFGAKGVFIKEASNGSTVVGSVECEAGRYLVAGATDSFFTCLATDKDPAYGGTFTCTNTCPSCETRSGLVRSIFAWKVVWVLCAVLALLSVGLILFVFWYIRKLNVKRQTPPLVLSQLQESS